MFVILSISGNQYKVAEGETLQVAKLPYEEGSMVQFDEVMLMAKSEKDVEVGTPYLTAVVTAEILDHGKGEKIRVVKTKRRKRYTRVRGHRQMYTTIVIRSIELGKKKDESKMPAVIKTSAKKVMAEKAAKAVVKTEKKAPAKKVVAKKPAAKATKKKEEK